MRKFFFLLVLTLFVLYSCASVVNKGALKINRKATYAIIPFENYTETPLAGYRVASIAEGVLASKGIKVVRVWRYSYKEPSEGDLKKLFEEAKKRANYVIFGSVNEFRYKTGIDGEPVVSITLRVYDTKTERIIYTGTASASGWAYESLGTIAQRILNNLVR